MGIRNFLAAKPSKTVAPANPRKVAKGTSYQATGFVDPTTNEVESGSSQGIIIREVVPDLISPFQRLTTYAKMLNDSGVDVSMRAAKTPILGAEFYVDAYSPEDNDQLISEFIAGNLFDGMSAPFLNALEDILRMYEDGYSVMEKVYENREWTQKGKGTNSKQYTMLKKLGVRPASTVKEILYDDNGGPTGITQAAIKADKSIVDTPIDIGKILIFTFGRKGGDLTGKSLLRTAYQHWFYKNHFYKVDAIQKERHGIGVPKGKLQPGYTPGDREAMRTLLRNLRSNEEAFMLLTPGVDVEFAEFKGVLVDVLESAVHHNGMILLNVLAEFLALGVEKGGGGGRATAGSQVDIYMKAFKFVANYLCEVINMYVIPELVVYNFKSTNFPKLKVRNIGETRDLQMLGSAIANLAHEKVITIDDDTEQWVRRTFDMPALTLLGQDRTVVPTGTVDPNAGNNGNANGTKNSSKKTTGTGNVGKPPNAAQ